MPFQSICVFSPCLWAVGIFFGINVYLNNILFFHHLSFLPFPLPTLIFSMVFLLYPLKFLMSSSIIVTHPPFSTHTVEREEWVRERHGEKDDKDIYIQLLLSPFWIAHIHSVCRWPLGIGLLNDSFLKTTDFLFISSH